MGATGLSADPKEYRARLVEQPDEQIDAWVAEMLRDVAKRRGVVKAIRDFRAAAGLGEVELERVFSSGGGAPATLGRDADGNVVVPAITLWALPRGLRAGLPDARERLVDFLVANFEEIVYV